MAEIVKQTVGAAQKVESLGMAFEALTGSAAGGEAVMSMLEEFAKSTPFQMDELAAGAKQILLAGVSVNDLQRELKILGNIAAVSGVSVTEIANIYQKMGATGKVGAEEMNQLARAGVPIYDALADVMGVAKESVAGLVTKGQVGFPEIQAALNSVAGEGGKFGSAMDKMAASGAGLVSTLLDNWEAVKRTVGKPLNIALKPALSGVISMLEILGGLMEWLAPYMSTIFGAGFGVVVTAGVGMAHQGFTRLRDTLVSLIKAGGEMGQSIVSSNLAVAGSARVAATAQASVGRSVFKSTVVKPGTTVLPSYQGKSAGVGRSTVPMTPVFDMSKTSESAKKMGDVAGKASKGVGALGKTGALLAGCFGPAGLAIMGAGSAIGYVLDVAGRHAELGELAKSMEEVGERARTMAFEIKQGSTGGVVGQDGRAAELKKNEEDMKKAKKGLAELTDLNLPEQTVAGFGAMWDDVFNEGMGGYEDNVKSLLMTIHHLENQKEQLEGLSALRLEMAKDEKNAADAEQRALAASEAAIKQKIDSVKGLKDSYEKAKKSAKSDDLMGADKLQSLEDEKNKILKGRSVSSLEGVADELSRSGSGKERVYAAELYEGLTRVLEIEKAIVAEKDKQSAAMGELDKQYALEVSAIEHELEGHKELADSIRDRIAVEETAKKYREAGMEAYAAQSRAEELINAKRRVALQQEKQERDKKRGELAREELGLATREGANAGGISDGAVGIVERMDALVEKYADVGMTSGRAMSMAMREGGIAAAEQMKQAMTGGAVSSLQRLGGGGRYEVLKDNNVKVLERQVKELISIRDGVKALSNVGGL